jgi:hypothetical protein
VQQRFEREADLYEQKVGFPFPSRQFSEAGGRPQTQLPAPGKSQGALECPGFGQHRPNGELARATAHPGFVTTNQEELIHSVSFSGKQVPLEPEQISISCVQTGD